MSENQASKKPLVPNLLLRAAREQRGWTHEDVARMIDLPDPHTVGRWERGENSPRAHYRRELCRIFGMSLEALGLLPERSYDHLVLLDASSTETMPPKEPMWKVPATFTSFIGRDQETATVSALLKRSDVRLLTLIGPGGVGKTRLCISVASALRSDFADGVCCVSLASVRDPALVIPTIASALDVQEHGGLPLPDLLKATLRTKHFLLLLDNFEQVAVAAPFLEELLAACPDLKVLVASRAVLHLQAEHTFHVRPLRLPDVKRLPSEPETLLQSPSVALFVQRAQAVQHDFRVTPGNIQAIAEICIALEGLPLALELAAARVNLLSPQSLLARLSQDLHFLKSGIHMLHERHQTLYGAIQWSYDLLNDTESWLFRHLSVFCASWTLQSAEQTFGNGLPSHLDMLDLLSSLLDKSLLQRVEQEDEESRFSMLEMMREYGLDCLRREGELVAAQRTHAHYYLAYVEEAAPHLKGALQMTWLARLERELENLRAALSWLLEQHETEAALRFCEAFGKFCGLRGYWSEEQRWLSITLTQSPEPSLMRGRVLRRAGYLAYRLRDLDQARTLQEESIAISRVVGDRSNLAGALSGLAWTLYRQKDAARAQHLLDESVAVARSSGDVWSLANSLESQCRLFYALGCTKEAHQLLLESVALMRGLGDKEGLARFLLTLAPIELFQGNPAQANALTQESYQLAQALGTLPLQALVLDNLGNIALYQGEYERAAHFFAERIALAQQLGDRPAIARNHLDLSNIALIQGKCEQAVALARASLAFFRAQGDSPNIAASLNTLGAIAHAQGDYVAARAAYREALLLDRDVDNKRGIGRHLTGLSLLIVDQQHFEEATHLFGLAASYQLEMNLSQRSKYEHAIASARSQLGDTRFEAAWAKGRSMSLDQVLSLA